LAQIRLVSIGLPHIDERGACMSCVQSGKRLSVGPPFGTGMRLVFITMLRKV
jgi:hypothetical protein